MKVGETWKVKDKSSRAFKTSFGDSEVKITDIFKHVDSVGFEQEGRKLGMPREMFVRGFEKVY